MHESVPPAVSDNILRHLLAPARHLLVTCSAGRSHLLSHLLCWMSRIACHADKPLLFGKNLFEQAMGRRAKKTIHLLKQVEQVKTARESAATTQQNAVQGCDPASFGPRPRMK
jgi:hypothetical protein